MELLAIQILRLLDHSSINSNNVWPLYEASKKYSEDCIIESLLKFIDEHAGDVLNHVYFLKLDLNSLKEILSRDSLQIKGIKVFNAVQKWLNEHKPAAEIKKQVESLIRLSLITVDEYLGTVRETNFFSDAKYLDAISDLSLIEKEKRSSTFQSVYKHDLAPSFKCTSKITEQNVHLSTLAHQLKMKLDSTLNRLHRRAANSCSLIASKRSDNWYIPCIRNGTNKLKHRGRSNSELRFLKLNLD